MYLELRAEIKPHPPVTLGPRHPLLWDIAEGPEEIVSRVPFIELLGIVVQLLSQEAVKSTRVALGTISRNFEERQCENQFVLQEARNHRECLVSPFFHFAKKTV